jgi:hypothetical protein
MGKARSEIVKDEQSKNFKHVGASERKKRNDR